MRSRISGELYGHSLSDYDYLLPIGI